VEGVRAAGHERQTETKNHRENDSELHVRNS